jgi:hypothetical protein
LAGGVMKLVAFLMGAFIGNCKLRGGAR